MGYNEKSLCGTYSVNLKLHLRDHNMPGTLVINTNGGREQA